MAHLCVPQNQALVACRGFVPDVQICGTHGREDLVNATIISKAEEEEEPLSSTLSSHLPPTGAQAAYKSSPGIPILGQPLKLSSSSPSSSSSSSLHLTLLECRPPTRPLQAPRSWASLSSYHHHHHRRLLRRRIWPLLEHRPPTRPLQAFRSWASLSSYHHHHHRRRRRHRLWPLLEHRPPTRALQASRSWAGLSSCRVHVP